MREILIKPQIHKFEHFKEFAEEFELGERDLVFTNRYLYEPYMKDLGLGCRFVLREIFGKGEPSEEMIDVIFAALNPSDYDRVVAVGGGAILDMGKVLALKRTGSAHELYFRRAEAVAEKELIAVPTTCGTGSEVTNISVAIVREDSGSGGTTKLGLVSDQMIPGAVCLIPELLEILPYQPFASSAIDALIHAAESYLSPGRATMTSELFGVKAMELILKGFRRIGEEGKEARFDWLDEFLTAACYAGIAFLQAGCATVHAMSFPLGGTYHVPHGESNYALFIEVLKKYEEIRPEGKISGLKRVVSEILGCGEGEAIASLAALLEQILPWKSLREYGVQEKDIRSFTDSVWENQQRLVTNSYIPLDKKRIEEIYRQAF